MNLPCEDPADMTGELSPPPLLINDGDEKPPIAPVDGSPVSAAMAAEPVGSRPGNEDAALVAPLAPNTNG
ncbi:hypothetical protein DI09_30p200 [Mitosporidium daphniae]|uniref:Uncharacterized protein n=1 Tax=Mitosporidium daphniae TaxID=1485682 RepID=A0A098VS06_9MICR|nr:uncharacterized protein DI09_30p200 [Mitosporidium daphniae]KGG51604.1 hypothetical protein DI09_30p200 [Mitosporidium daphniae]|eukprot:XP_013238031.1 uncharacterized protein DI09_30p200 [Mitosporidium daphniae]